MSDPFDNEEIVSLVKETTGSQSSSRKAAGGSSSSTPGSPFRSCWFIVVASLGVLMTVAFFSDAIEININKGAFDTENKLQSNSTSPKVSKGKKSKTSSTSKDLPPLVHSPPVQEPGYKANPAQLSDTYLSRGKPINATDRQALAEKYGTWTLVDPKADQRPRFDFYSRYPNRDIPRDQFPVKAWQIDRKYLAKFLPEAKALIERSMEAMLAEYGHSAEEEPGKTFEERAAMFNVSIIDIYDIAKTKNFKNAGWMTQRASDGLVRRLLHAVMTEDTFTVVMGGHSAAAGHGNIFQQSYTLQIQKVLEPVFARLGVKHTAHNMGMGGLGTIQNGLAAGDLYGKDVDILFWDSGMTEKSPIPRDLMMRQGIMAGDRVPVIGGVGAGVLKLLDVHADADVVTWGSGTAGFEGIPTTVDQNQSESLPWAARYVICKDYSLARKFKYDGMCWIDRPDFTPAAKQKSPGGRVSWHPGNLSHQLNGRVQSFPILKALHEAITMWAAAPDYALPDAAWHVADYYKNIRSKVLSLNSTLGFCHGHTLPNRVCDVPMNGRSEYLPRRNPAGTSIRSILKFPEQIDAPARNSYDPPDIRLPFLEEPYGAVDYLNIVENGVDFVPNMARIQKASQGRRRMNNERNSDRKLANPAIVPGLGWTLNTHSAPHLCDGSYDSFCGKEEDNNCLLYGHNDHRGGIFFDSYSGWLIVNLEDLKHGLVILRVETWHGSPSSKKTKGWQCENNICDPSQRRLESLSQAPNSTTVESTEDESTETRRLKTKTPPPEYCDDFQFEFALDGEITTWSKADMGSQKDIMWTLLDDPDFIKGKKPKDVELAIRQTGCGRVKPLHLTHVYWA
jgi:hypothetical protein